MGKIKPFPSIESLISKENVIATEETMQIHIQKVAVKGEWLDWQSASRLEQPWREMLMSVNREETETDEEVKVQSQVKAI